MAELTWSAIELAEELGVSEWLIRHNLDRIPHLRIGQRVVFPKFAVRTVVCHFDGATLS